MLLDVPVTTLVVHNKLVFIYMVKTGNIYFLRNRVREREWLYLNPGNFINAFIFNILEFGQLSVFGNANGCN